MKQKSNSQRGGHRNGAGRPQIHGTRHTWVVPYDVEQVARERGTAYIWEAVRIKVIVDHLYEEEQKQTDSGAE